MKEGITFYVPTFNSQETIEDCLKAIFSQTIKPMNVLIIDGGSTDKTLEIVKRFKAKMIRQKEKGLAAARNLALKDCSSRYIAGIDSDCVISADWTKKLIKHLGNKKVAGACGRLIEKNNSSFADRWRADHLRQEWGENLLMDPNFLYGSNSIFLTDALKKVKGYDQRYKTNYEDVDISARLAEKGFGLVYDPDATAHHIKKDSIISVIMSARRWSFYSYPLPDSIPGLVMRLLIYNPYLVLNHIIKDLMGLNILSMIIDLMLLAYCTGYDLDHWIKTRSG